MDAKSSNKLSIAGGTTLYVGALLGPGLLLLPGLAQSIAGPAAILAWAGLLVVSGLLAVVFATLGSRAASGRGVAHYAALGLGEQVGSVVAWCFLAGVVVGAPVVCLIGGSYLVSVTGGSTDLAAAALLLVILILSAAGLRAAATVQLVLVGLLLVLIVVAVLGSAPAAHPANLAPFAPHGWASIGKAAAVIMLSFVGWEAAAPLSTRLGSKRALRTVIGLAFTITAAIYLALSVVSVLVLGTARPTEVPLADLMSVAVGPAGRGLAAAAAVALTVGSVNAYLTGAAAMVGELRPSGSGPKPLFLAIGGLSCLILVLHAAGLLTTAALVSIPTTLFVAVYLGCTVSAARVLTGAPRLAAIGSALAVIVVLAFCGWALLIPLTIAGLVFGTGRRRPAQASELRAMVALARRTARVGAAGTTSVRNS